MELDNRSEPWLSASRTSTGRLLAYCSYSKLDKLCRFSPRNRNSLAYFSVLDDDEPLLTPIKKNRRGNQDRFLISDIDASTIQLLMDLEGESDEDYDGPPVIDISGMNPETTLRPPSPLSAPLSRNNAETLTTSPSELLSSTIAHELLPPPQSPPPQSPPPQSPPPQSPPPQSPPPQSSPPLSPERSASPITTPTSYSWSADPPSSRPSFEFSGDSTLLEYPKGWSPSHFFDLMFTDGFFNMLVIEINSFADELMCQKVHENLHRREQGLKTLKKPLIMNWQDVTVDEVKKWLGITFMMGIIKLDRLRDYWVQNEKFGFPFFRGHMSRERWFCIMEALHFAPNETSADPIFKIRPLITYFHNRMAAIINPGKKVCIDESLAPWRGRVAFRQYLPMKCHRYGIKFYMLTEPDGLIHRFLVYAGAGDENVSGPNHTTKVIMNLMSGYLGAGRSLFQDNFYNSVELVNSLLIEKTSVTGTLRPNRKNNPPELASRKLKKGESVQRWTPNGIYVTKWKDKRDVWMISSEFSGDLVSSDNRRGSSRKPQSVVEYNKCMGGIDLVDQHLAYYTSPHRSIKWYKKIGIHICELLLLNAFFLYRRFSVTSSKLDLYSFRLAVVDHLCGEIPTPTPSRVIGDKLARARGDMIVERHFPRIQPPPTETRGRRKQLRCRRCYERGTRKQTSIYCGGCPDEPGLCLDQCFIEYHRSRGVMIVP